jgi:hypothetical protein
MVVATGARRHDGWQLVAGAPPLRICVSPALERNACGADAADQAEERDPGDIQNCYEDPIEHGTRLMPEGTPHQRRSRRYP